MRVICICLFVLLQLVVNTACPQAKSVDSAPGTKAPAVAASSNDATEVELEPRQIAPSGAASVTLTTSDDYHVAAWFWQPTAADAPGVVLLHMRGKDKRSWGEMPTKLVEEGYAVIAIVLRGHGETTDPAGNPIPLDSLKDNDYQAMLHDVQAAHDYLDKQEKVDGERVGIVGASIGANLAVLYAASDRRIRTVVALSPGLNYRSLQPAEALPDFGERALYLLTSKGDKYSYDSCLALEKAAVLADPVSLREFAGSEHGTDLFAAHPGLDDTIISGWLLNHLPPQR